MTSPLKLLQDLVDNDQQPAGRTIWLGLGIKPPKQNAIELDPSNLPTDDDCKAVAGLDVILSFYGYATKYGTLARLCGSLYQARPRRLILVDADHGKYAFLKLGGRTC
jgi:hypothetical protein